MLADAVVALLVFTSRAKLLTSTDLLTGTLRL